MSDPGIIANGEKRKFSDEFKRKLVADWKSGKLSHSEIIEKYKIGSGALSAWAKKIADSGAATTPKRANGDSEALALRKFKVQKNKRYPKEAKEAVLKAVASGITAEEISAKTGIHHSTVYSWAKEIHKPAKANGESQDADADHMKMVMQGVAWLEKAHTALISGLQDGSIPRIDKAHRRMLEALDTLNGIK